MINKNYRSTESDTGFTLIEVLVAVLVLSIGLLGLAGLQANSLRFNTDSSIQTQAAYMANDMADRMRANAGTATLITYPSATATQVASCYNTGGCTPGQMASNDLYEWNQALAGLPAGQGTITALGGGVYNITVRWDELRNGATGLGCDPAVNTDLRCLSITTQP